MDDWVLCSDDLPMLQKGKQNVSVTVIARQDTGEEQEAFCDHRTGQWYASLTGRKIPDVIAWQSLPAKEKAAKLCQA